MTDQKILIELDEAEREYKQLAERCENAAGRGGAALRKEIEARVRRELEVLGEDLGTLKALKLTASQRLEALRREAKKRKLTPLSERPSEPELSTLIEKPPAQSGAVAGNQTSAKSPPGEQKPRSALELEFDALDVETILKDALPSSQIGILIESNIKTGADLHRAYEKRETDRIKGIGEATWQKITDAVHAWHEARANQVEENSDESTPDKPPALGNDQDVQR